MDSTLEVGQLPLVSAPQSELLSQDAAASSPQDAAPAEEVAAFGGAPLSLKDLFGAHFHIDDATEAVEDPMLLDTRAMLQNVFGDYVEESDLLIDAAGTLAAAMKANREALDRAQVEQLFGVDGANVLMYEKPEEFTTLQSTVPPKPNLAGAKQTWLVDMPKINPNRQTLHADPQPYNPESCHFLPSDARMLYTPHNILRWAYSKKANTYMSNARVVRWSDGSVTLHVGTDVHSLQPAKGNAAVNLLGTAATVKKGSVELPVITTTVVPDRHLVVESKEAPSIESALFAESAMHRVATHRLNLAYTTTTLPPIDWSKPKARNPQEEFVASEYDRRNKELARRYKEGRPMTLKEQLDKEQEMLELLRTSTADGLQRQNDEARREAALRQASRGAYSRPNRLQRDLGLSSGDAYASQDYVNGASEANMGAAGDSDSGDEGGDYESILRNMQQKRQREDDDEYEQRRVRVEQAEEDAKKRFAPLLAGLEAVVASLPMDSSAYGAAGGVLEFLKGGNVVPTLIEKEIPSLLDEITQEVPSADTASLRAAYNTIFQR